MRSIIEKSERNLVDCDKIINFAKIYVIGVYEVVSDHGAESDNCLI